MFTGGLQRLILVFFSTLLILAMFSRHRFTPAMATTWSRASVPSLHCRTLSSRAGLRPRIADRCSFNSYTNERSARQSSSHCWSFTSAGVSSGDFSFDRPCVACLHLVFTFTGFAAVASAYSICSQRSEQVSCHPCLLQLTLAVFRFVFSLLAHLVPPPFLFRAHAPLLGHDCAFVEDLGLSAELAPKKLSTRCDQE